MSTGHVDSITAVITCYKEGELLRRAVASLELQSDQDFEIIIVNDASPDETTNRICRDLQAGGKIRVAWRSSNGGLSAARNSGYEAMSGEICVPLDADDTLPANAIASIREAFRRAPFADFVFGDYIKHSVEDGREQLVECREVACPDGSLDPRMLCGHWILLGTSPCRKSAWRKVGGYSGAFSYDLQDVDFFMRLLTQGAKGYYINEPIYIWHRSATGMNSTLPVSAGTRLWRENILFYDSFGDGTKARKDIMWESMSLGDFDCARKFALELMRRKCFSRAILAVALLPPMLSSFIYHAIKTINMKEQS